MHVHTYTNRKLTKTCQAAVRKVGSAALWARHSLGLICNTQSVGVVCVSTLHACGTRPHCERKRQRQTARQTDIMVAERETETETERKCLSVSASNCRSVWVFVCLSSRLCPHGLGLTAVGASQQDHYSEAVGSTQPRLCIGPRRVFGFLRFSSGLSTCSVGFP